MAPMASLAQCPSNPVLTPTLLWKYPICNNNSGVNDVSSPAVVGGVVYVEGTWDHNVYALNAGPTVPNFGITLLLAEVSLLLPLSAE